MADDYVRIAAEGIVTLPDYQVTTDKLADSSVTADKIAPGAITADKIAGGIGIGGGGGSGVSVKQFGAKGDGTTDDYPAIAAAIESLTWRGGTIVFPPGDYLISQSLTALDRLHLSLVGEGGQFSTRITAASNFPVIAGEWKYCRIEGFTVDAGGHGGMGLDVFLNQTYIRDVFVTNWTDCGMRLNDWAPETGELGWLNVIEYCHVEQATGTGIRTGYRFTDSWIQNCNIEASGANVDLEGWVCRVVNNHLNGGPTHNVVLRGNRRVLLANNIFELPSQEAVVYQQPPWEDFDKDVGLQIVGNIFVNTSYGNKGQYAAISLNGLSATQRGLGFVIADNTFDVSEATAGASYCVDATNIKHFSITGNLWYNAFDETVPMRFVDCEGPYNITGNAGIDGAIGP